MSVSKDHDLRKAALIFFMSFGFLSLGAFLGLNLWPAQEIFDSASGGVSSLFVALSGSSIPICVIFWGGRPSVFEQRAVLFLWPVISFFFWLVLKDVLDIGWFDREDFPGVMFFAVTLSVLCLIFLFFRIFRIIRAGESRSLFDERLCWLFVLTMFFIVTPRSALSLSAILHPATFDLYALHWDHAAGLGITPVLSQWIDSIPGLSDVVRMAYGFTPLSFLAVAILQLRGRPAHIPSALLLWVILTVCAMIAYHFFPIVGPKYIFGSADFISSIKNANLSPVELVLVQPSTPRNGMPSMHFGWMLASALLWWRSPTRWPSRIVILALTVLTAAATLYLGEHYVVDLIVAIPFVLAAISLATTGGAAPFKARWLSVALGFLVWLIWIFCLRFGVEYFIRYPVLCYCVIFCNFVVVYFQLKWQRPVDRKDFAEEVCFEIKRQCEGSEVETLLARLRSRIGGMFFASGAAALIYQVVFAKELALIFGSTSTATFTVLATFLGGMAIGSAIGGVWAEKTKSLLGYYAILEAVIGAYCIVTPFLFLGIHTFYGLIAGGLSADSVGLLGVRVLLGAAVLLFPTVLMGVTLPLLVRGLSLSGEKKGGAVAWLYACNTAGAALGALLASYVIIPFLGVRSTTLVAALFNFLVALGAFELGKNFRGDFSSIHDSSEYLKSDTESRGRRRELWVAWFVLGAGGLLSLGLEVVYVHLLSIVAGNSAYAFGLMLATFLVGLALGGEIGRLLISRFLKYRSFFLVSTQLLLAVSIALCGWGWDAIPEYFASFSAYPVLTSFSAREAVRGIVCALVMIPPTVCIGIVYTLAMDMATSVSRRREWRVLGFSAAINTLGNILGVLVFGFWVLPWLGGLLSAKIIATIAVAIALVVMLSIPERRLLFYGISGFCVAIFTICSSPGRLNYDLLSSGANVYFAAQNWGNVISHSESIDGGLTTVSRSSQGSEPVKTLLTNGKFQGNDALQGEVQSQIGFAALPLLHQKHRNNALVIGYGTGVTSRVMHDAGFAHLDIAEISKDVVRLADENFQEINSSVSTGDGVQLHVTDGRNLLFLSQRRYDIISIEITSIWFAGAASLYNKDFYALARSRMTSDGVLQQWVQLHHMQLTDLLTVIGTLRSEFKFVSLYVVGGQGVLIATNDEKNSAPLPHVASDLDSSPRLSAVRSLARRSFSDISRDLVLTPEQVDFLIRKFSAAQSLWVSTDDNLRLEYSTPKANVVGEDRSSDINLKFIESVKKEFFEMKIK